MADTSVEITSGTGTNIDTRTEGTNGNHRQVVVIGDPATNAGVAPVDVTNGLSVTLTTAIPAGTNAIGKLAANSGVDIGDVDVASCALPTGAATAAKQLPDGHNVVVSSGNITCSGTVTANLSATDNAVLDAIQVGTDKITACNTGAVVLAAGTAGIGKLTANDGVDIGNVDVASIAAGDNNIGNVDIASALPAGTNLIGKVGIDQTTDGTTNKVSSDLAKVAGTTTDVNSGNKSAGSQRIVIATDDVNLSAIKTAVELIDDSIATSGSATTAKGVTAMGAYDSTNPTAVDDGDAVAIRTDATGQILIGVNPTQWRESLQHDAAVSDHALISAPGAGLSLYLTDLIISNGATAGYVLIEEDTASAKTVIVNRVYLAANGGCVINFKTPLKLTANKDLGFTSNTVTTHSITVSGYTAP